MLPSRLRSPPAPPCPPLAPPLHCSIAITGQLDFSSSRFRAVHNNRIRNKFMGHYACVLVELDLKQEFEGHIRFEIANYSTLARVESTIGEYSPFTELSELIKSENLLENIYVGKLITNKL